MTKRKKAKHLTEYPMQYPWDKWLRRAAGKTPLVLERGVDFLSQIHSMSVQIRNAAAKRDWVDSISVHVRGNGLQVIVALVENDDE